MRHQKAGVKLNRTSSHRNAMFRNMVTSLFKHDRIQTTDAKAKELRRWADNLITLAKRGDLHARRQALSIVRAKDIVHKLFAEAPQRYGSVSGGYTRIVKLGRRPGDSAAVSMIELVGPEKSRPQKVSKKKEKAGRPKKETKPEKAVPDTPDTKMAESEIEISDEKTEPTSIAAQDKPDKPD